MSIGVLNILQNLTFKPRDQNLTTISIKKMVAEHDHI